MALGDVIAADVTGIFLNEDFRKTFTITPQGGIARAIYVQVMDEIDQVFDTGTADIDFDTKEILVCSGDNTNGLIAPSVTGRGGVGDTGVFAGSAVTWYVRKVLEDGRQGSGMHRLLIANSNVAWPELF